MLFKKIPLFWRFLSFPRILMGAEWSKGFWSTALRSKLCPSWKSCISTLNSWARWADPLLSFRITPGSCNVCLQGATSDVSCGLCMSPPCLSISLSLCFDTCKSLKMNVIELLAVMTSWCDYLNIHPAPPHLFHLEISRRFIGDDTQNILYSVPWCTVQGQSNLPLLRMSPFSSPVSSFLFFPYILQKC